jgi:hypothetical protein
MFNMNEHVASDSGLEGEGFLGQAPRNSQRADASPNVNSALLPRFCAIGIVLTRARRHRPSSGFYGEQVCPTSRASVVWLNLLAGRGGRLNDLALNGDWLRAMKLHTDSRAIALLDMATSPAALGPGRETLELPPVGEEGAQAVALLLRAGKVPTPGAVGQVVRNNESRARFLAARAAWPPFLDGFGGCVAAFVDRYWRDCRSGPTWSQAFSCAEADSFVSTHQLLSPNASHRLRFLLMRQLVARGWLSGNDQPRSLCPGPTYYAFRHNRGEIRRSDKVGESVARAVGEFRSRKGRSPTWRQLARHTYDHRHRKIFRNTDDVRAQSLWLLTEGWIQLEEGEIRRGPAAKCHVGPHDLVDTSLAGPP